MAADAGVPAGTLHAIAARVPTETLPAAAPVTSQGSRTRTSWWTRSPRSARWWPRPGRATIPGSCRQAPSPPPAAAAAEDRAGLVAKP